MKRTYPIFAAVFMGLLTLFMIESYPLQVWADAREEPLISVSYILDMQQSDVTGDGIADRIEIVGQKAQAEAIYAENIQLVIQDGRTGEKTIIDLPDLRGYEAKLFLGDFTGDQVRDILLSLSTGSSGGIVEHRIITYTGKGFRVIFDKTNNEGVHFTGQYLNDLKAELKNEETGRTLVLDVSRNRETYWLTQIYDRHNRLLKKVTPYALPFSKAEPVQRETEGVYELKGYQRVSGAFNTDGLGQVQSWWKYENDHWVVKQIEFSTFLLTL